MMIGGWGRWPTPRNDIFRNVVASLIAFLNLNSRHSVGWANHDTLAPTPPPITPVLPQ